MDIYKSYFATVAPGLEKVAAQELERLGAMEVKPDIQGVYFQGNKRLLYRVNLWARTIFRVLVSLAKVNSYNAQELYKSVYNIDWSNYLHPEQTLAVTCTGGNKQLNHTHFTALQIKNAIVDQQRKQFNKRSIIEVKEANILIHAHIYEHNCTLSLDSSGESLHRRGYRPAMGLAPLKETLAAGLLDLAQWHPQLTFLDPLCGSGTLPLEATLKALNIAPGLYRQEFAFQRWPDFQEELWEELWEEAQEKQLPALPAPILGSDQDGEILEQAYYNAQQCGVEQQVKFMRATLSEIEAPTPEGIIMCNPPYGKRLGNAEELGALYKQLGDIFKQRFKGWTAYILTGNKELGKQVGLRTKGRFPVYNGSLPCTLLRYELY